MQSCWARFISADLVSGPNQPYRRVHVKVFFFFSMDFNNILNFYLHAVSSMRPIQTVVVIMKNRSRI